MSQDQLPDSNQIDQADLAYRQALQYGQDMVELYKQERQKREALEIAYTKLAGALESMSDGFLVVDKSLMILEMNQACADLFEISAEEAQGISLEQLLIGSDSESFTDRLLVEEPAKHTAQIDIDEPLPRTLAIETAPLPSGGWVLVLHDVTWEERVNTMREEFLHLAAHELRTPLTSVIGFTSLLGQVAEDKLDSEMQAVVSSILNASEKLRRAMNNLLDSTANQAEQPEVDVLVLQEVVEEALSLLTKLAADNKILVSTDLPAEPMQVFGCKKMLVTAAAHLIENGIRYNKPGGSLTISGSMDDGEYRLIFTDTGKGISRKDLNYITTPFFQAEKHTTRRSVGMGLGLSIVQRTLSLHHGALTAKSRLNKGSTFTVTLPCFAADDLDDTRQEWQEIQNGLQQYAQQAAQKSSQSEADAIIEQLRRQLEVTQSQNLQYARDLAKLYQLQREISHEREEDLAKISHTDRLALMGQLAAGVAHDLSNLIGPILGYSQIILRQRDEIDPTMVDVIERILNTSQRANMLLRQMVTLSKTRSQRFEHVNVAQHVRETLEILMVKIRHANIDLLEAFEDESYTIYGDPIQISQVILNIVVNAIDAMPSGGVLTVKTSVLASLPEFVQLQISDTGQGITTEDLSRIFEPFFTTKADDAGTGLGLAVSQQIVDSHGGRMLVDSVVGTGTAFTILWPSQAEGAEQAQ